MSKSLNLINKLCKTFLQKGASAINISDTDGFVTEVLDQKFGGHPNTLLSNGIANSSRLLDAFDQSKEIAPTDQDIWIFGYGSLMWKADFPYIAKKSGYIRGYERRFYQNSIDHRGVPEKPGRVVTLIHSNEIASKVYGVAYRIAYIQKDKVLEHLDYREKNGYERSVLKFLPFTMKTAPQPEIDVIMYIATDDNDSYAGHISDLDDIAEQIYWAKGPSGTNREYLYKLATLMRSLFPGVDDEHLFSLEAKLRGKTDRHQRIIAQAESELRKLIAKYSAEEEDDVTFGKMLVSLNDWEEKYQKEIRKI